jgi:hypothetical protein
MSIKKGSREEEKGHETAVERKLRTIILNEYGKMNNIINFLEQETYRVNQLAETVEMNNEKAYAMNDFSNVLTPPSASSNLSNAVNSKYQAPSFLDDKDKRLYNAIKSRIKVANEIIQNEENKIFDLNEKNQKEKSNFIGIFDSANDLAYKPVDSYTKYQTKESLAHFLDFKAGLGLYKSSATSNNNNTQEHNQGYSNNLKQMNARNKHDEIIINKDAKYYTQTLHGLHAEQMKIKCILHNHNGSSVWDDKFKRFETLNVSQNKKRNNNNLFDNLLFKLYYKRCETASNIFIDWIDDVKDELNLTWHGNANESHSNASLLKLLLHITKILNDEINDMKYQLSMYRSSAKEKEMIFIPRG